jgi:hypothetical protein
MRARLHRWSLALTVIGLLAAPASVSLAAPAQPVPLVQPRTGAPPPAVQPYAAREAASRAKVETFQGGGTGIYIGGTTAVIVLLVIIVIILL